MNKFDFEKNSVGGYFAVFELNENDGSLIQVGNTKQSVLEGKSVYYAITNQNGDLLYAAEALDTSLTIHVYPLQNGSILPQLGSSSYPYQQQQQVEGGGAKTLSLTSDNKVLLISNSQIVLSMEIDATSGLPFSNNASLLYSSNQCLGVVQVSSRRCGRVIIVNTLGIFLFLSLF